jgi:hypothetical protein
MAVLKLKFVCEKTRLTAAALLFFQPLAVEIQNDKTGPALNALFFQPLAVEVPFQQNPVDDGGALIFSTASG